jgi:hypothetical protein
LEVFAEVVIPGLASGAGSAAGQRFDDHAVALRPAAGFRAHRIDNAAYLVTGADLGSVVPADKKVQVTSTDSATLDGDPDLSGPRGLRFDTGEIDNSRFASP